MRAGQGQETWKRWVARTRVPSDSDECCFVTGAAETVRESAGGAVTGEKCIEFQFTETAADFFLYIWRKNWHQRQLRER